MKLSWRTVLPFLGLLAALTKPCSADPLGVLAIAAPGLESQADLWKLDRERTYPADKCMPEFVITLVTTTFIHANYQQDPNGVVPGEIKAYIADMYATLTPRPAHVVLFGEQIPSDPSTYVPTNWLTGRNGSYAYDDWYVCMEGASDLTPDLTIGRIGTQSPTDVATLRAKVLAHENGSWRDQDFFDWRHDILLSVNDIDVGGLKGWRAKSSADMMWECPQLAGAIKSCGLGDTYGGTASLDWSQRDAFLCAALAQGAGLWMLLGSSGPTDFGQFWTIPDHFNVSNLPNANNRYPVLLALTCGVDEYTSANGRNTILNSLLFTPNKGIVAGIAATTGTLQREIDNIGTALLQELTSAAICGEYRPIGEALRRAKVARIESGSCDLQTVLSLRLKGDPTMKLPIRDHQITNLSIEPTEGLLNAFTKVKVTFTDPSLPPTMQDHHSEDWETDKGVLCAVTANPPPSCIQPYVDYTWGDEVYIHCNDTCGEGIANITANVIEGQSSESWFHCNFGTVTIPFEVKRLTSSGCPIVDVQKFGAWQESNSVLSACAYDTSVAITDDYFRIPENPVGQAPVIDLRVRESDDNELTSLDYASLWIADHPAATKVYFSQQGTFWSADSLAAPDLCRIPSGPGVTEYLHAEQDSLTLTLAKGDSLLAVFSDEVGPVTHALVDITAREKPQLVTQALIGGGQYGLRVSVTSDPEKAYPLLPRKNWIAAVVDSPIVVRGDGVPDTILIVAGEPHELDRVALVDNAALWIGKTVKRLVSATHSDSGVVTSRLSSKDAAFSTCHSGQNIVMRFEYPPLLGGYSREIVLVLRGGYSLLGTPRIRQQEAEAALPWGIHGIDPNPMSTAATLRFVSAGRADCAVEVFDVGGRRIRQIPIAVNKAGLQAAVWDGYLTGGSRAPSGVYFVRLREGERSDTGKLVVVR